MVHWQLLSPQLKIVMLASKLVVGFKARCWHALIQTFLCEFGAVLTTSLSVVGIAAGHAAQCCACAGFAFETNSHLWPLLFQTEVQSSWHSVLACASHPACGPGLAVVLCRPNRCPGFILKETFIVKYQPTNSQTSKATLTLV